MDDNWLKSILGGTNMEITAREYCSKATNRQQNATRFTRSDAACNLMSSDCALFKYFGVSSMSP